MTFYSIATFWNALELPMELLMGYAHESNTVMILLSLFMSLVFMVYLKSVSVLLRDPSNSNEFPPSPIDIDRRRVITMSHRSPLMWRNYNALPPAIMLLNNGSTVLMRILCSPGCKPHLCGGPLNDDYYFVEASFKWGGSEHTINSRRFALEMQVLHATNASGPSFQYVTISYLFAVTQGKTKAMDLITENLAALVTAGSVIEVPPFDLDYLFWPFSNGYYNYSGTYDNGTTILPTEWLICLRHFEIGAEQLAKFFKISNHHGVRITGNSREMKSQGNRQVYVN